MGWTFADLAAHYRRQGQQPPSVCGEQAKAHKYRASATVVDGITFASKDEATGYRILKLWERSGVISGLKRQPRFLLQDAFFDNTGAWRRAIYYVADFRFIRDGKEVVIDVKGFRLALFIAKEKLFRVRYPEIDLQIWDRKKVRELAG